MNTSKGSEAGRRPVEPEGRQPRRGERPGGLGEGSSSGAGRPGPGAQLHPEGSGKPPVLAGPSGCS